MERYDPDIAGTSASNWGTNNSLIKNGQTPAGKPQRHAQSQKQPQLSHQQRQRSLFQPDSFRFRQSVFRRWPPKRIASSTLTLEPGVVIKFNAINKSGLQFINGSKLSAVGSSVNPIIFTSFTMIITAGTLTAVSAPPRLLTAIGTASELIRPGRNQPSAASFSATAAGIIPAEAGRTKQKKSQSLHCQFLGRHKRFVWILLCLARN